MALSFGTSTFRTLARGSKSVLRPSSSSVGVSGLRYSSGTAIGPIPAAPVAFGMSLSSSPKGMQVDGAVGGGKTLAVASWVSHIKGQTGV